MANEANRQNWGDAAYWRDLAAFSTKGATAGQLDAIAAECMKTIDAGGQPSIWHAASVVFGTLEQCPCFACTRARAAA